MRNRQGASVNSMPDKVDSFRQSSYRQTCLTNLNTNDYYFTDENIFVYEDKRPYLSNNFPYQLTSMPPALD